MAAMTQPPDFASGPLTGVRVLDLSRVIAGPYLGRLLADLGADVIKVEPPEGDLSRQIAPKHDRGMSALYTFANVGKRCVGIDLRKPGATELVLDLVRISDAVIENFRPGVLDGLGLDWKTIREANPRTNLVSLNGFGATSSWRDRRAYAPIVHAVTGILDDQGAYADQPVTQINAAHADTITSLHGAIALLSALRVAEATGRGQHIEVPMFDAVLTSYSEVGSALLDPPNDLVMNPIYDAGSNGVIATAGPAQHLWRLLTEADPELADPTPPGAPLAEKARLRHRAIAHWMAAQPGPEALLDVLAAAGVACAPVVTLPEALNGPLARERDLLHHVDDRRGGSRAVVRPPARFSDAENRVRGPAPQLGEHNHEVLGDLLGYDPARIEALAAAGVLSRRELGEP